MRKDSNDTTNATLPRLNITPISRPAPEEIERRRALVAKVLALRDEMASIGVSATDLAQEVREDESADLLTLLGHDDPAHDPSGTAPATPLRIELPPMPAPTAEELERRREVVDRILARRDRIGPIGISVADLIREVRNEADGIDD